MFESITKRLSLVFSSATPWLVILTGVGISIVANGISDLIQAWQEGTSLNPSLWLMGLGMAMIFVLFISIDWIGRLRNFIRANWRDKLITPNFDGEVRARRGLVVLVSNRPNPPAQYAIEHHAWNMVPGETSILTHCWLIAGPGEGGYSSIANAKQLENYLKARNIRVSLTILTNLMDVEESYKITKSMLHEAINKYSIPPEALISDYTGGTKPMTVGMLLASVELGVDLQYMDSNQLKRDGRVEKIAGGTARPVNLSFWKN